MQGFLVVCFGSVCGLVVRVYDLLLLVTIFHLLLNQSKDLTLKLALIFVSGGVAKALILSSFDVPKLPHLSNFTG